MNKFRDTNGWKSMRIDSTEGGRDDGGSGGEAGDGGGEVRVERGRGGMVK